MPVVIAQDVRTAETSSVTLAMYARHLQICECAFWGVKNQCAKVSGCRNIWTLQDREWLRYYLGQAQQMLEEALQFRLGYQWDSEKVAYSPTLETRWGYVLAGGQRATSVVASGAAVDLTTDPAVIGPVATTVTDSDELHLYHAGTSFEIDPSQVTLSGGFVTFYVPRCRLVKPEYVDNPETGWDYNDDTYFAATVDIQRVYNDTTTPVTLYYNQCQCDQDTQTGCVRVLNKGRNSVLEVRRTAALSGLCGCGPNLMEVFYYGGQPLTHQAQDAVIRLAHTLMPQEPCGCSEASQMWVRDRRVEVDGFNKPIRGVSPFGPAEGAWIAWIFTQSLMKAISLTDL